MFELETFKELLSPYKYSLFNYVLLIIFFVSEGAFSVMAASLRSRELDQFQCNFLEFTSQCFRKYDSQYNSPLPLHGFAVFNVVSMMVVCSVYSCRVQSIIGNRRRNVVPMPDEERPRSMRQAPRSRQMFWCYLLHLVTRLIVMTPFTALLTTFVLHREIPFKFSCVLPPVEPWNITNSNFTNTESYSTNCFSPVAFDKIVVSKFIWTENLIFSFLLVCEIIYLVMRALRSSDFTFDAEFRTKYLMNKGETPLDFRERMKEWILSQTQTLHRLVTSEGDKLFDDMFVYPVILLGKASYKDRTRLTENNLTTTLHEEGVLIKNFEELFLPNVNDKNSRNILIVGGPGTGKSLLCNKLLRDWSNNARYIAKRFDYAFLLKFRWFDSVATKLMSLRDLLNRTVYSASAIRDDVFKRLCRNPKKILIMFDGLDEFNNCETRDTEERYENSVRNRMPFFSLYLKLLRGKLLCGATILTTCRANVTQKLSLLQPDKSAELMGFTKEEVFKYVDNYCKEDESNRVATKIKEHINTNEKLLSLCCIPLICRIVCFLLRDVLISGGSPETRLTLATNVTSVYKGVLKLFIFSHHPECRGKPFHGSEAFPKTVEQDLSDLGTLAKRGTAEERTIFSSKEVTTRMRNSGLLNKLPDIRVNAIEWTEQFCFIDSSLQEFLAAREVVKMDPDTLSAFITKNAEDPKWQLVIQFVAGLLSRQREEVNSLVNCLHN